VINGRQSENKILECTEFTFSASHQSMALWCPDSSPWSERGSYFGVETKIPGITDETMKCLNVWDVIQKETFLYRQIVIYGYNNRSPTRQLVKLHDRIKAQTKLTLTSFLLVLDIPQCDEDERSEIVDNFRSLFLKQNIIFNTTDVVTPLRNYHQV